MSDHDKKAEDLVRIYEERVSVEGVTTEVMSGDRRVTQATIEYLDQQQTSPLEAAMEAEAWEIMNTFHDRFAEAEKRIDRVLARLNVE